MTRGEAEGWQDLEQSLRIALKSCFHEHAARAYYNLLAMSVARWQFESADRYRSEGLEYCDDHDLNAWRLHMLACGARLKLERGDWEGCTEDVHTVLKHPNATPITRIPALTLLGQLRIRRGDPDSESPLLEARQLSTFSGQPQVIASIAEVRAEAAWLDADRDTVVREIGPVYSIARQTSDPRLTGRMAVWLHRVNALNEPPARMSEPYALEIAGRWQAAAAMWQELGCPYEQATLLALHGCESRKREALAIFERLGVSPAVRALRKQLRAEGVKGVPRGARSSTQSHPFGLTRREAEILDLLSEGMRNSAIAKRLFVAKKTVDHHVSAILMKLGVPSRAQAVALSRRGRERAVGGA